MKRLLGYLCFAVSMGGLGAFYVAITAIVHIGTCASGTTPYVIARTCPSNTGQLVATLLIGFVVSLAGAIAAANLATARLALIWWAALFVPLGVGFGIVAHGNGNVGLVFYGLAAVFVIMGVAPFFMSQKQLEDANIE